MYNNIKLKLLLCTHRFCSSSHPYENLKLTRNIKIWIRKQIITQIAFYISKQLFTFVNINVIALKFCIETLCNKMQKNFMNFCMSNSINVKWWCFKRTFSKKAIIFVFTNTIVFCIKISWYSQVRYKSWYNFIKTNSLLLFTLGVSTRKTMCWQVTNDWFVKYHYVFETVRT